jgi:hypothetical protein
MCLGFVQKQVPDSTRISNKMALTLTLSRPTGEVYQYRWESSQVATIFCLQHPIPNIQHPTPLAAPPGALDVGRSMLVVGCFGCGFAALRCTAGF